MYLAQQSNFNYTSSKKCPVSPHILNWKGITHVQNGCLEALPKCEIGL